MPSDAAFAAWNRRGETELFCGLQSITAQSGALHLAQQSNTLRWLATEVFEAEPSTCAVAQSNDRRLVAVEFRRAELPPTLLVFDAAGKRIRRLPVGTTEDGFRIEQLRAFDQRAVLVANRLGYRGGRALLLIVEPDGQIRQFEPALEVEPGRLGRVRLLSDPAKWGAFVLAYDIRRPWDEGFIYFKTIAF